MGTLLVAIGVTVCLAMLARAARPVARVDGSESVLEYRRVFQVVVVLGWLLVLLLVAVAAADPSQRALAFFLIPAFAAMTVYLQLEFSRVRILVGREGIRTFSPWRRPRVIPWEAVTGVRYAPLQQQHIIETDGYGLVRLPLYLSGVESLLGELGRRGVGLPPRSA